MAIAAFRVCRGDSVLLGAHEPMHAASTMKVGVLIELYRGADLGRWGLSDSLLIENRFRSIVDGSPYALDLADDSDSLPYARIGREASLEWLAERMVTVSSNLATNLLVELVSPDAVSATLGRLGAGEMRVVRGVEDQLAYERGLNNTTSAYGFARALLAIARAERGEPAAGISPDAARAMVRVLSRQRFGEGLPAGVPGGVVVAHKTGSITAIEHDGGIVYPPGGEPYVLAVLTRGFREAGEAQRLIARVSEIVWESWGATSSEAGSSGAASCRPGDARNAFGARSRRSCLPARSRTSRPRTQR